MRIGLASFLCFVLCFPRTALEALTELSEVLPSTTEKEILQPLHIFSNGDFKWGSLVSLLSRNGEVLLGHSRPSQTFLELLKDEVAKEGCALCIEGFINIVVMKGRSCLAPEFFGHLDQEMENIFEGEDASQYASSSEHWQEL